MMLTMTLIDMFANKFDLLIEHDRPVDRSNELVSDLDSIEQVSAVSAVSSAVDSIEQYCLPVDIMKMG